MLESMSILSAIFLKIGVFGFGGGYAMLPLMFQEVQRFGVMSSDEFSNLVAISQVTPGPVAVNAATYVGYQYMGVLGSSIATISVALPSFFLIILAYRFMSKFKESKGLSGILYGIRPATVALIASAVVFIGEVSILNSSNHFSRGVFYLDFMPKDISYFYLIPLIIAVGTLVGYLKFKINPILLTIFAGILGAFVIR